MSRWLVEDGSQVRAGQLLVEVETDKATVEIEAPGDGRARGSSRPRARSCRWRACSPRSSRRGRPPSPRLQRLPRPSRLPPARSAANGAAASAAPARGPIASPAARRLARESAASTWRLLQGSGPGRPHRRARDIAAAARRPAAPAAGDRSSARPSSRNITASWQQIPHVHIGGELEADGLVQRAGLGSPHEPSVTVTDLLVVALARALAEVPELNALRRRRRLGRARASAVHLSPRGRDSRRRRRAGAARRRLARRSRRSRRSAVASSRPPGGHARRAATSSAAPARSRISAPTPSTSSPRSSPGRRSRWSRRAAWRTGSSRSTAASASRPRMWVNVAIDHRAADGEAGGRLLAALERQIALLPGGLA